MKKLLLAAAVAFALPGSSLAADMPVKAPPIAAAPMFNWTGFYIGGNGGGVWNSSRWTDDSGVQGPASNGSGGGGGGQIGYNYQINQLILGVEGDFDATSIGRGVNAHPDCEPSVCQTKLKWLASLRGRIGYAVDRLLVYATGGAAFAHFTHMQTPVTADWSGHQRTGWTAGLGIEYALTNNWIAGLEWKYYDFGSKLGHAPGFIDYTFKEKTNTLMARISYKFGGDPWGKAPVVAKY